MKSAKEWAAEVVLAVMTEDRSSNSVERLVERVQVDARAPLLKALADARDGLSCLERFTVPGSTAEDICERLLPKIEEALR